MVMPTRQRCPKCHQSFMGSDCIGGPCPDCVAREITDPLIASMREEIGAIDVTPLKKVSDPPWEADEAILFRWSPPDDYRDHPCHDCPTEYVVTSCPDAPGKCIIYVRYRDRWHFNGINIVDSPRLGAIIEVSNP